MVKKFDILIILVIVFLFLQMNNSGYVQKPMNNSGYVAVTAPTWVTPATIPLPEPGTWLTQKQKTKLLNLKAPTDTRLTSTWYRLKTKYITIIQSTTVNPSLYGSDAALVTAYQSGSRMCVDYFLNNYLNVVNSGDLCAYVSFVNVFVDACSWIIYLYKKYNDPGLATMYALYNPSSPQYVTKGASEPACTDPYAYIPYVTYPMGTILMV